MTCRTRVNRSGNWPPFKMLSQSHLEKGMSNVLKKRPQRVKINKKNSLTENLYLDRQGQWASWKNAAWFSSEQVNGSPTGTASRFFPSPPRVASVAH